MPQIRAVLDLSDIVLRSVAEVGARERGRSQGVIENEPQNKIIQIQLFSVGISQSYGHPLLGVRLDKDLAFQVVHNDTTP